MKIISLIFVIVLAAALILRLQHSQPPDELTMPCYNAGQVLAEQAVKVVQDRGRVLLARLPSNLVFSLAALATNPKRHVNGLTIFTI